MRSTIYQLSIRVGQTRYNCSIGVVPTEAGDGELEQLVSIQSEGGGRLLQARVPRGFFVSNWTVGDLVRQAQRKGWRPAGKGSAFKLDWDYVSSAPEKVR